MRERREKPRRQLDNDHLKIDYYGDQSNVKRTEYFHITSTQVILLFVYSYYDYICNIFMYWSNCHFDMLKWHTAHTFILSMNEVIILNNINNDEHNNNVHTMFVVEIFDA